MPNRRDFLKTTVAVGAASLLPWEFTTQKAYAASMNPSPNVTKFADPLVIPPIATPNTTAFRGFDYYELPMNPGFHKFHSELGLAPTWSYGGRPDVQYLGPTIEAQSGRPVRVKFTNNLGRTHLFGTSIDPTLFNRPPEPGANPGTNSMGMTMFYPDLRTVPHLHGGFSLPEFDGHPEGWFTNDGVHGMNYTTHKGAKANEVIYDYTNLQRAAPLWYHDHSMGITRLNVYAGLAALYFIRDSFDTGKASNPLGLPAGPYEVPLLIQDKSLNPDGTMAFPTSGVTPEHPIWMPEFFGDIAVVNGTAFPHFDVEPRRYRLRVINGSNARFYNLKFPAKPANLTFWVIGTDGGLLPAPVPVTSLLLAPAERADIIFDFTPFAGTALTLMNDAKAPFPGGQGGDVAQIMQFRVVKTLNGKDTTTDPAKLKLPAISRLSTNLPARDIFLKETAAPNGEPLHALLNERWFSEAVEEMPKAGSTEMWQIINTTGDAHPIHIHLVEFQVVNRQPFDSAGYLAAYDAWVGGNRVGPKPDINGYLTGAAVTPPPEEAGFKDTVKSWPGQVTRFIAKFDVPPGITLPGEYMIHCHILDHEDNEMMRPWHVV